MPLLHRKTILISTVLFGVFLLITQPLYRLFFPVVQFDELTSKPAFQLYAALAHGDHPTRTLLVFANHAEQRIGGGFVGSVGVLNGAYGKVQIESVRSIYYYDHRLEDKGAFAVAPQYLTSLISTISARDSLLATSTDKNAALFRDLYARESGEYIDNVVIITPKVLSLFLHYTGPIELSAYNLTVTSDNILSILQQEVESGQDKVAGKDPKTILKVLAEQLMTKLPQLTLPQLINLSDDLVSLMQTQQLYTYLKDQSVMQQFARYQEPLARPGETNTLHIAAANHIANKSSQAINQTVQAKVRVAADGVARLSLSVSRTHTTDYTGHYIDPRSGRENYIIGDDLSWLQVTLPAGTEDIKTNGLVAQKEPGVFGVDVMTKPLSTSVVTEEFVLPMRYAMLDEVVIDQVMLAQFGWFGQKVDFTVEMPENYMFVRGGTGVRGEKNMASRKFFQIDDEKLQFVFRKQ